MKHHLVSKSTIIIVALLITTPQMANAEVFQCTNALVSCNNSGGCASGERARISHRYYK